MKSRATSSPIRYWLIKNESILRLQLAKEIREIYENDAIFSIIASASGMKDNDKWQKDFDSTCTADYLYAYRATK